VDKRKTLCTLGALIGKVNVRIDRLILLGKPYAKEAQEHKRLLTAYNRISSS
jgi:hypothetical protein